MSTSDEKNHMYRPDTRDFREIIETAMSDESRATYAKQVAASDFGETAELPYTDRELEWSKLTAADIPDLIDAFDRDDDNTYLIQQIAFLALRPALRQGLSFSDAALAFIIASEERKMTHVLPVTTED